MQYLFCPALLLLVANIILKPANAQSHIKDSILRVVVSGLTLNDPERETVARGTGFIVHTSNSEIVIVTAGHVLGYRSKIPSHERFAEAEVWANPKDIPEYDCTNYNSQQSDVCRSVRVQRRDPTYGDWKDLTGELRIYYEGRKSSDIAVLVLRTGARGFKALKIGTISSVYNASRGNRAQAVTAWGVPASGPDSGFISRLTTNLVRQVRHEGPDLLFEDKPERGMSGGPVIVQGRDGARPTVVAVISARNDTPNRESRKSLLATRIDAVHIILADWPKIEGLRPFISQTLENAERLYELRDYRRATEVLHKILARPGTSSAVSSRAKVMLARAYLASGRPRLASKALLEGKVAKDYNRIAIEGALLQGALDDRLLGLARIQAGLGQFVGKAALSDLRLLRSGDVKSNTGTTSQNGEIHNVDWSKNGEYLLFCTWFCKDALPSITEVMAYSLPSIAFKSIQILGKYSDINQRQYIGMLLERQVVKGQKSIREAVNRYRGELAHFAASGDRNAILHILEHTDAWSSLSIKELESFKRTLDDKESVFRDDYVLLGAFFAKVDNKLLHADLARARYLMALALIERSKRENGERQKALHKLARNSIERAEEVFDISLNDFSSRNNDGFKYFSRGVPPVRARCAAHAMWKLVSRLDEIIANREFLCALNGVFEDRYLPAQMEEVFIVSLVDNVIRSGDGQKAIEVIEQINFREISELSAWTSSNLFEKLRDRFGGPVALKTMDQIFDALGGYKDYARIHKLSSSANSLSDVELLLLGEAKELSQWLTKKKLWTAKTSELVILKGLLNRVERENKQGRWIEEDLSGEIDLASAWKIRRRVPRGSAEPNMCMVRSKSGVFSYRDAAQSGRQAVSVELVSSDKNWQEQTIIVRLPYRLSSSEVSNIRVQVDRSTIEHVVDTQDDLTVLKLDPKASVGEEFTLIDVMRKGYVFSIEFAPGTGRKVVGEYLSLHGFSLAYRRMVQKCRKMKSLLAGNRN